MNPRLVALLFALILTPVLAECTFLQVEPIAGANVTAGTLASFPIAIKNNAPGIRTAYLSAYNNYLDEVETYFDSSASSLAPSESKVFTFFAIAPAGSYDFPLEIVSDSGAGSCSESISLHLNVEGAQASAVPAFDITATISPEGLIQVFPGTKTAFDIVIRNGIGEEIVASLDAPSNPFDSGTSFSETDFKVAGGVTKVVKASVTLPPGAPAGDYDVIVRVQATTSCCVREFLLPIKIRSISKKADLRLINPPLDCISVKHGEREQVALGVRNDGEMAGPFTLSMNGDDEALKYVRLPLRQFELSPGERDYFNLTIFPSQFTPIDTYHFTLEARYLNFLLFQKEICYEVEGVSNVQLEKPEDARITRCETGAFKFKVRNTGTLEDEYAIEAKPLVKAKPFLEPETFTLSPGESQIVNYIVQSSCNTPLGTQLASIVIRPKDALALSATMPFEVLPKDGKGLLEIDAPALMTAIEGAEKKLIINVFNTQPVDMPDTSLAITGIPPSWIRMQPPLKTTIKPEKAAPFSLILKPAAVGSYKVKITAKSGTEVSQFDSELVVEKAIREIDYSYELKPMKEGSVTRSALVTLIIRNKGNTAISNIGARIEEQNLNLIPLNTIGDIQPGESKEYRLQIQPLSELLSKDITLKVFSEDGAATGKPITLPAMSPETVQQVEEFPWRLVVIAILVLLAFFLLARQTI